MAFLQIYALVALAVFVFMVVLWVISLILRDSSIVDPFWGTGFVIANWVSFALTPGGVLSRKVLISVLATIWGLRLSLYLLWRNWGKGEDFRYRKWRDEAGPRWWWLSLFKVFLLQGLLMWVISAPLLAAQFGAAPARLTVVDLLAVPVWLIGFFFESVGDLQLARFRADPGNKGKVLRSGVWRYTRHPNYFGDATQWWAFYLVAAAGGGYWTIFSPLLMTTLLLRVSGVTLLERSLEDTKPGYRDYVETTSAFVPWFLRRRR